ncbi:MAG: hypothetical protein AAGK04_04370 [Planctomycetota bacterium]
MRTRAAAIALSITTAALAGPLTPPAGPVSATPKTLQSIEPRIELNATNTPGDASAVFVISQPGSYYLSDNIDIATNQSGVRIASNDVSLDLNGFALIGNGSGGRGVTMGGVFPFNRENIIVRNGTARGWNTGIDVAFTINAVVENISAAQNVFDGVRGGAGTVITNCNSSANNDHGFVVDAQAVITNCQASGNQDAGFQVGAASTLVECVSRGNQGEGYDAGPGSTLASCVADANANDGFQLAEASVVRHSTASSNGSYGVYAEPGAVITHCSVFGNGFAGISLIAGDDVPSIVAHNVVEKNASNGIEAVGRASITDNVSTQNELSGIIVRDGSVVARNNVSGNGTRDIGNTGGIETFGDHNRIEANHATDNEWGLLIDGFNNLVVKNSSCNNSINDYLVFGGNFLGQLTNDPTNAGPWWNFACDEGG